MRLFGEFVDREVTLANGAVVPFLQAEGLYSHLVSFASVPGSQELMLLGRLRAWCFGHSLSPEDLAQLQQADFVGKDGKLHPVLREVVLASLRGQGSSLYLDSPFTKHADRDVSEVMAGLRRLQAGCSQEEWRQFTTGLVESPWTNNETLGEMVKESGVFPEHTPPPGSLERLLDRLETEQDRLRRRGQPPSDSDDTPPGPSR